MIDHQLADCVFPSILTEDNVRSVKKALLSIYKTIYHKARLEQRNIEHTQIQRNIKLRCINYDENLTRMIDSILNREKQSIILDRLLVTDPVHGKVLITDATTIQKHAVKHFQQYALPQAAPPPMNERWSAQFAPKHYIQAEWYQHIMVPPT